MADNQIKVSIICNVYNHGKYVRDALEGFVMQKTNFPFEVLIHDDASTDNSAEIIREYEEKYPDLIKPIYQKENQFSQRIPIFATYQNPRIKGKYVATCEGDDYWTDPEKLQKQYDFMEANPEYSLCAGVTVWQNLRTGINTVRRPFEEDTDISLENVILHQPNKFFHFSTLFLKAEPFKQMPEWRTKMPVGDYNIELLAALYGKVRMLADEMSVYRYYADGSWTVRMDNDQHRARISERMLEGLEALDAATDYQYTEVIQQRKLRHKYMYALMTHDLKMLRTGELKETFRSRSFLRRSSDVLRCKYPKLYAKMLKPFAKVMRSRNGEQ